MNRGWFKRLAFLLMVMHLALVQGCGYVAAGAAGAVIGHEVAEEDDDD